MSRCGEARTLKPGGTCPDRVCFTYSAASIDSVEMSMTVNYVKLLDIDHLMRWNMGRAHALGVVLGQMALFGDGVRDFLDSFRDFLTDGAVGFTNPVAGASER
jgi:hypothetical protein